MKEQKALFFKKDNKEEESYICDLKANMPMSNWKQRKYIKSVINGKYAEVKVSDESIVRLIINLTRNGDPINAFTKILKQIGVKFPIKLRGLTGLHEDTFTCETADSKELSILMEDTTLSVTENGKTSYYNYLSDKVYLNIYKRVLVNEKGEIKTEYHNCSNRLIGKTLSLSNEYELFIRITEHSNEEVLTEKISDQIDSYLLSIVEDPISSFNIWYEMIKEICGVSDMIKTFPYFNMQVIKRRDSESAKILYRIRIEDGVLKSYVSTQGNKEMTWDSEKWWSFKENDDYKVSCKDGLIKVTFFVNEGRETTNVDFSNLIKTSKDTVLKEREKVINS